MDNPWPAQMQRVLAQLCKKADDNMMIELRLADRDTDLQISKLRLKKMRKEMECEHVSFMMMLSVAVTLRCVLIFVVSNCGNKY